jgi:hypothetical protein
MWREFGLAGDWRSHASHVILPPRGVSAVHQVDGDARSTTVRQGFSRCRLARVRLGAGALDGAQRGRMIDRCRKCSIKAPASNDALVGLQGQLGQRMHRLPVHGERLEAEYSFAARQGARAAGGARSAARGRPSFRPAL